MAFYLFWHPTLPISMNTVVHCKISSTLPP
jgi:hypothetical protein